MLFKRLSWRWFLEEIFFGMWLLQVEQLQLLLQQLDQLWCIPKSLVKPTWGSNYVELWKVGTWGALSTSNTKMG